MIEIPDSEKLLTFKETMEHLRIGSTTLYRFMQQGDIKGYKVGCTWRFYLEDIRNFVNAGKSKGSEENAALTVGNVDTG